MPREKKYGDCAICDTRGELSFEHVPPEAAFNSTSVRVVRGEAVLDLKLGEISAGSIQQRGAGDYTLCVTCNNNTGSWYGTSFAEWCAAGMDVLRATGGEPACIHIKRGYPLRIIKQIVALFCSIQGVDFVRAFPEVKAFLLNKRLPGMPSGLRVFVHYAIERVARQHGMAALVDLRGDRNVYMSELVFPPFGYALVVGDEVPDSRLVEITDFANHDFDRCRDMTMNFPLLPAVSPFPGDYRTRAEIVEEAARAEAELAARRR